MSGGPPGSFIEDNNEFALALVMTIPLLRFLQLQLSNKWARLGMTAVMLLCAASVLGSQSRGAFLAIAAMTGLLWLRGKNKLSVGVHSCPCCSTDARLHGLKNGQCACRRSRIISRTARRWGASVRGGRLGEWQRITRSAPVSTSLDRFLWPCFHPIPIMCMRRTAFTFRFSETMALLACFCFWRYGVLPGIPLHGCAERGLKNTQSGWCADLGAMCQVSLIGYLVGGAFLSLSYFDLPYNIMIFVVLARRWVQDRAWEKETSEVTEKGKEALPQVAPPGLNAQPDRAGTWQSLGEG